ncbi:Serine/threonine-protein kinase Nek2 [Phytophthora cinnamomi]|uniref:Serine/threonine-protein kinase Nek2 n=1 Tax=Phytophthora cinnamomi TaxID=4785 RepID=UPI00355A2919|nr:Serine/threonine-protein kinase Nek2 [Phytophthora cinnamomi]
MDTPKREGGAAPEGTRNLRAAHFHPSAHRVRGDFAPTATHDLAAHRLAPYLTPPDGAHETPMDNVLRIRESFTFDESPAIDIAAHSPRIGRHGLSIMHCKRVDRIAHLCAGSADANFNMDFSRSAPPSPVPTCTSYFDLLSAAQGLTSFANAN